MKLANKFALSILSGALALSMAACSSSPAYSTASINALINDQLDSNGSAYTVVNADLYSDGMVSLVKEAVSTYQNYKNCLINTDELAQKLDDDDESRATIKNKVNAAKAENCQTRENFNKSLVSFNLRGIGRAYVLTGDVLHADVSDEAAIADYVAARINSDGAKVYVSDIVEAPVLDDDTGSYTGNCSYFRLVYIG